MITYNTMLRYASILPIAALVASASHADIYTSSDAPEPVIAVSPEYPEELLRHDFTGQALVEFTIDEEGNVQDVVVKSATSWDFGQAARDAIRKWKYEPPRENGRPVSIRAEKRFDFRLNR